MLLPFTPLIKLTACTTNRRSADTAGVRVPFNLAGTVSLTVVTTDVAVVVTDEGGPLGAYSPLLTPTRIPSPPGPTPGYAPLPPRTRFTGGRCCPASDPRRGALGFCSNLQQSLRRVCA